MNVPESLLYTKEHEWARVDGDVITIGITDHAQSQLGDVTYVELPKVGDRLTKDTSFGVVESVKAASDLYAPLSGEVLEANASVVESPDGVNADPYGDAWMVKIKISKPEELKALMRSKDYEAFIKDLGAE